MAAKSSSEYLVDQEGYRYMDTKESGMDISIDGILDEAAWQNAKFQDQFLQREPKYGEKISEETLVAVLKDKDYLYIGIKCYDNPASKIIANEMRRDARVDDDDFFELILDTFHDHRNGYYFIINPNGVKRDATVGDEGKSYNPDWDGIWDCATEITEEGWFAEIAIPWKTLRFDPARDSLWGINFARMIRRKNEHAFWQLVPLDAGRGGLFRISQAGELRGLTNIQSGGNIDIEPYLMGGISRDPELLQTQKKVTEVGIDATLALTSNVNLKLSWNTDFAQVESDQAMVNLTRFSLYFPEKREFFLDGAEIFNFGSAQGRRRSGMSESNVNLFYSRRIGIVEGYQQPIIGGAKLLGKLGSYQFGFLSMQTEEITAIEDDVPVKYEGANYSVFRLRKDLFKRSSIGVMMLNKQSSQSPLYNRSAGIDAIFPLTETFTLSGNLAASVDPAYTMVGLNDKNLAGSFSAAYDSDLWELSLSHLSIQENFNAEMGFIRRTDIRHTASHIEYSPRPSSMKSIRQFRYQLRYTYVADQQNHMLENELGARFSINFQNSSIIYLGMDREMEYIDEDWEVREDIIIPRKMYESWESFAWLIMDESKDLSASLFLRYGDYFGGKRFYTSPEFVFKSKRVRADLDFTYINVALPAGNFDIRTIGTRFYYFFSTKLFLKAYIQWNDDQKANEGDRIALSNVLLRWIYRPGSDIYLVYNEGWNLGPLGNRNLNRTLLLKFTYFWRN